MLDRCHHTMDQCWDKGHPGPQEVLTHLLTHLPALGVDETPPTHACSRCKLQALGVTCLHKAQGISS